MREAASEEAVVEVVRAYTDEWSSEETMALPPSCRPGRIRDRDDVCGWAVTVARERLKPPLNGFDLRLVDELGDTLREAANRIAQLSSKHFRTD